MADITKRPVFSHFRGSPTNHVVHVRRGKTVHEGVGQAFWFRPLTAVLAEVPVDDRELPMLFHARTKDFQDVAVQASMTYRFVDPGTAIRRLDFAVDPATGKWNGTPLEQVAMLLTELAQQHAHTLIATLELADALAKGPAVVQARITEGLAEDARLADTGIGVVGVRVVAVSRRRTSSARCGRRPGADPAGGGPGRLRAAGAGRRTGAGDQRERAAEPDRAGDPGGAAGGAGGRERPPPGHRTAAAGEIALEAEVKRIRDLAATDAERTRAMGAADADRVRALGAAQAESEAAMMAVHAGADPRLLLALAARSRPRRAARDRNLDSPDMVTSALSRLANPAASEG